MNNAATLRAPLHFEGVGLHTGEPATMEIRPSPPGSGVAFVAQGVRIPAIAEYASESPLATVIGRDGVQDLDDRARALRAARVRRKRRGDRAAGPEIPILDGSARPYIAAIEGRRLAPGSRAAVV